MLNGASCSGKTSIAKALQDLMEEPLLHVGLHHVEAMQSIRRGQRVHAFYGQGIGQQDLLPVLHQCVASFATAGVHVVLEHIFLEPRWLRDVVDRLHGHDVLFVDVSCPPEELERRECARYARLVAPGQAPRQFQTLASLRALAPFDLVVDTTTATPEELADLIKHRLADGPAPTAFRRLRTAPFLRHAARYGLGLPPV